PSAGGVGGHGEGVHPFAVDGSGRRGPRETAERGNARNGDRVPGGQMNETPLAYTILAGALLIAIAAAKFGGASLWDAVLIFGSTTVFLCLYVILLCAVRRGSPR